MRSARRHRLVVLLFAVLGLPVSVSAGTLLCERFEAMGRRADGPDDTGWHGGWQVESGAYHVEPGGQSSTEWADYGWHATLTGNSRICRRLDTGAESPLAKAGLVDGQLVGKKGGVLYVGFLQQISAVPTRDRQSPNYLRYYALEFKRGTGDENRVLEIGHDDRSAPGENCYGADSVVNNGCDDSEPGQFRSLGPQNAGRNLIVVKFTFGGGSDRAEIFRNPPSRSQLPAQADAVLEGDFRFDRIALARFVGNAPAHAVDAIRFGTAPADVWPVKVPEDPARLQATVDLRGKVDRLLLVKRHAYQPTHIYTECFDGPYRPGGGLFTLSPVAPDGRLTRIFDARGGICRDPDISFDGRRLLFSYRPSADGFYHVYEMNVDGSGLRQLTDGPFHDLDPFYLPDGRIGLTSSRCKARTLCFWVQSSTLFVMDSNGRDIRPLSYNNVTEFTPDLLPDGRILYTRWEYMDKSAIFVQSLWSILPDGTAARQVYGNNMIHPVSILQARSIPGTHKILATLSGHNGYSYGPLAVIDPGQGVDNPAGILNLVPEVGYGRGCFAPYPLDDRWCLVSYGPDEPYGLWLFSIDPPAETIRPGRTDHPLNDAQFPANLGTYWASAVGQRHLIYRDPEFSCVEAIPIAPRPKPPAVASALTASNSRRRLETPVAAPGKVRDSEPPVAELVRVRDQKSHDSCYQTDQTGCRIEPHRDRSASTGTLLLADVYQGLGRAVPRGRVKYLRLVEEMGHRDARGDRDYQDGIAHEQFNRRHGNFMRLYASPWENGKPAPSLQAKYVYGTVPVEADGSAYFTVPAERPIYFQVLDEQHNEIQRMRSYIHLRPGERLSCIGCHEPRTTAPPAGPVDLPLALRREPSAIDAPPFGAGAFSYARLVQPVLDRRCASCHATDEPAGGIDLSSRRDARGVPASFATLVRPQTDPPRPPLVNFFDNWWGVSWTVPVAQPLRFGAAVSPLVEVIDSQHGGVEMTATECQQMRLTPEERRTVTTWIDLNCPLWDNYSPEQHLVEHAREAGKQ
jgi:hypothetical protein